ncbi:MAG: type IV pilus modification protein PilV [Proteobacteria bacterium]|nr:type IV pilus modification protein PilV [Pseudomonadota bacterium]
MIARSINHHAPQRGFTLVEALIAVLVLSIGLLGVAGLQLSSLRGNSDAARRSQATFLAYDIADRMRANRDSALAGEYDIALATATPAAGGATLSQRDLNEWRTSIVATLPSGATPATGEISRLAGGEQFQITVRWFEGTQAGAPTAMQFVTRTDI